MTPPLRCLTVVAVTGLDGYSLWLALVPPFTAASTGWGMIGHVGASLLLGWLGSGALPERFQRSRRNGFVVLALLGALLPVIGVIGFWHLILPALRDARQLPAEQWQLVKIPELSEALLQADVGSGPSLRNLRDILDFDRDPHSRVQAVLSARRLSDKEAVLILRRALRDPEDEVRLLARSILDKKEQALAERIRKLEEALAQPEAPVAALSRQLAYAYWELIYLDLAPEEGGGDILATAQRHATQALTLLPSSVDLHMLMGRILMKQGELDGSQRHFFEAERLSGSGTLTAAYLAELAYLRRDFAAVRGFLARLDPESCKQPPLSFLVRYWCGPQGLEESKGC